MKKVLFLAAMLPLCIACTNELIEQNEVEQQKVARRVQPRNDDSETHVKVDPTKDGETLLTNTQVLNIANTFMGEYAQGTPQVHWIDSEDFYPAVEANFLANATIEEVDSFYAKEITVPSKALCVVNYTNAAAVISPNKSLGNDLFILGKIGCTINPDTLISSLTAYSPYGIAPANFGNTNGIAGDIEDILNGKDFWDFKYDSTVIGRPLECDPDMWSTGLYDPDLNMNFRSINTYFSCDDNASTFAIAIAKALVAKKHIASGMANDTTTIIPWGFQLADKTYCNLITLLGNSLGNNNYVNISAANSTIDQFRLQLYPVPLNSTSEISDFRRRIRASEVFLLKDNDNKWSVIFNLSEFYNNCGEEKVYYVIDDCLSTDVGSIKEITDYSVYEILEEKITIL